MESDYNKLFFVINVFCILYEGKCLIIYFIIYLFLYKINFRIKNLINLYKGNI